MNRIILDLCGGTGSWSKPYKDAGYDVRLITLPLFDVTDEYVVQTCIKLKPYGILCASPCECWGMMGNCRWKERTKEYLVNHFEILIKNLRMIYECQPHFWTLENPPGKMSRFMGKHRFSFDPYEYGESYHKKTLLWGKFNPPTVPILLPERKITKKIADMTGANRKEERSVTPASFAQAFFEANP